MTTISDYTKIEREVAAREGKKGFVIHATVYAVVVTGLTILNLALIAQTDGDFVWFPFVLLGWGVGLVMHYLHGVRWVERELRAHQAEIERMAADRRG